MYRGLALSPDGTRVAIGVWSGGGYQDLEIWIKRLPDGAFSPLATTPESQARPSWAPDGRSVAFISAREDGTWGLVTRPVDRVAPGQQLLDEAFSIWQAVWAPDSSAVALRVDPVQSIIGNTCDIGVWEPGTDSIRVVATDSDEGSLALSPDGRWLAYESTESGRWDVYVQSFPDLEVKYPISTAGGRMPVWSRSGNELFYVSGSREMIAVQVTQGEEFEVGVRTALFTIDPDILVPEYENMQLFDVDVGDQRFLMLRALASGEEDLVMVIDWLEEVKQAMEAGR
jgi:Tol biopolymer transport system component